jgi:hypothetical protein
MTSAGEPKSKLTPNQWKKIRTEVFAHGECDVNLLDDMLPEQRYFVNQMKLAYRDLMGELND